jgi:hypothetical protein
VLALSPLSRDDPPVLSDLDRFVAGQQNRQSSQ